MIRNTMIALALVAVCATPAAAAQEQASAPVEASAAAPAEAPAAPSRAKQSLAEKLAIAAGLLSAGVAAYTLLKPAKAAPTPEPAATPAAQPGAQ